MVIRRLLGQPMHAYLAKDVTSLTLSYKQTVTANGIVAIAQIHRRPVNVYNFLSIGPTYGAMGKVVACRTILISNLSF